MNAKPLTEKINVLLIDPFYRIGFVRFIMVLWCNKIHIRLNDTCKSLCSTWTIFDTFITLPRCFQMKGSKVKLLVYKFERIETKNNHKKWLKQLTTIGIRIPDSVKNCSNNHWAQCNLSARWKKSLNISCIILYCDWV